MYFYRLWYLIWSDGCLLYCKHISLDFNCIIDFSSFHNRLKHLCNLKLVSILRGSGRYSWHVKLLFFHFLGSFSQNVPKFYQVSSIKYPVNLIFSVVVCMCKIHLFNGTIPCQIIQNFWIMSPLSHGFFLKFSPIVGIIEIWKPWKY